MHNIVQYFLDQDDTKFSVPNSSGSTQEIDDIFIINLVG